MALKGNINFPSWNNADFTSKQGVMDAYNQAGQNAASVNQQNWGNINAGYAQLDQEQKSGWSRLQNRVQRMLRGGNKANIQDINEREETAYGTGIQSLINAGLGNTTIQASLRRATTNDAIEERTRSRNMFAQTRAGYMTQIGMGGLQAGMTLGLSQLGFMASLDAPYPDASLYGSILSNMGDGGGGGGYGGGGYGGGGVQYPAMQGMHKFASDVAPMSYELGPTGGYFAGQGGYNYAPQVDAMTANANAGYM